MGGETDGEMERGEVHYTSYVLLYVYIIHITCYTYVELLITPKVSPAHKTVSLNLHMDQLFSASIFLFFF